MPASVLPPVPCHLSTPLLLAWFSLHLNRKNDHASALSHLCQIWSPTSHLVNSEPLIKQRLTADWRLSSEAETHWLYLMTVFYSGNSRKWLFSKREQINQRLFIVIEFSHMQFNLRPNVGSPGVNPACLLIRLQGSVSKGCGWCHHTDVQQESVKTLI